MKHLFILNPVSNFVKGKTKDFIRDIEAFFQNYPHIQYNIHVTRWRRDAVGYAHHYVRTAKELVRIYAIGGTGTLFEVINGVIGLPNVQVASCSNGNANDFIRYFGDENSHLFSSFRNQVFANTIPIDVIRCGHSFAIAYVAIGIESITNRARDEMMKKTALPDKFCYLMSFFNNVLRSQYLYQHYDIQLDDAFLSGYYISLLITNGPCQGRESMPLDARPNDGYFNIYLSGIRSKWKLLSSSFQYLSRQYHKIPEIVHYVGCKLSISSPDIICTNVDGEEFYDTVIDYEIIPNAIDFVYPDVITMDQNLNIFRHTKSIELERPDSLDKKI